MIDLAVDVGELSAAVASAVGRQYRLTPLKVKCTYPVFKGEADGAVPVFVKVGLREEWTRTANLLKDIGACGFFAKFLTEKPLAYHGHAVFVSEWRESRVVFPEDMSERQAANFVAGCVKLSRALQGARDYERVAVSPDAPERLYETVRAYARRHPVAGRFLRRLLALSPEERTFGGRPLAVLHGDFHAKNFGFAADDLSSVYDFDKLTQGLACGDLANALVERFSCLGMSAAARRRLAQTTAFIVSASPWPKEDFAVSCNVLRLRFAARRIAKHPDSAWVALDVLRRDRRIRGVLSCIGCG